MLHIIFNTLNSISLYPVCILIIPSLKIKLYLFEIPLKSHFTSIVAHTPNLISPYPVLFQNHHPCGSHPIKNLLVGRHLTAKERHPRQHAPLPRATADHTDVQQHECHGDHSNHLFYHDFPRNDVHLRVRRAPQRAFDRRVADDGHDRV